MGEAVERGVPRRDLFQAQERQGHGLVSRSALARRSGSPRLHRSSTADAGSRLSGRSDLWNADGTNSDPGRFCTALPDPFPPSPGPGKCVSPVLRRGYFSDRAAMLIGDLYGFRWVRPRWDRGRKAEPPDIQEATGQNAGRPHAPRNGTASHCLRGHTTLHRSRPSAFLGSGEHPCVALASQ